ncbi:MAG TPA: sugar ABC transporter permease [Casimicrobiaceae bacterium]|nr:sugar ABC transporter permease [Casimicrobiaceae bacterium]
MSRPLCSAAGRGSASRARHARRATLALLAPACLMFSLFVLYPIARSIAISLYDWDGAGAMTWVGLGNYRELFADPVFRTALANNLRWLGCYLLAPVLGLGLAVFLSQNLPGMRAARTLFFMPFVISQVVVGLIFGWFFNARFGLFNEVLRWLGLPPAAPLDSERWSIYALIAAGLWPQVSYCLILYLTGLATLPGELIDAARVDGAKALPLFRHVVLPLLRPVHFIVALVCAVAALRSFDYVMIMTFGGPYDSSTVLAYYMYEQTFVSLRYGYGAAIATVLLALMSAFTVALLVRLLRRER